MFVGNYSRGVDDKGRFIMPVKYRDQLDGKCIITRGMDGKSLYIYDKDGWREFTENLRSIPNTKINIRKLQRHFISKAEEIDIDKQGRCLLSSDLRAYAGVSSDVLLFGVGNKIELWSAENWTDFEKEDDFDASVAAEELDCIL